MCLLYLEFVDGQGLLDLQDHKDLEEIEAQRENLVFGVLLELMENLVFLDSLVTLDHLDTPPFQEVIHFSPKCKEALMKNQDLVPK